MLALAILSVFETMKHSNCLSSVLIQFLVNGYVYNQRLYFSVMNSYILASQVVLLVKNPHVNAGNIRDVGLIPGREDPLEEGMETHSIILVWRIPCTEEHGGLLSTGSQRVRCN